METVTPSLRLCQVMEEEYAWLHDDTFQQEAPLFTSDATAVTLLEADALLARVKPHYESLAATSSDDSQALIRYKKLAAWMRDTPAPASGPQKGLTAAWIAYVLKQKLDKPLETDEAWMREVSLRPYTRGLLQSFDEQQSLSSKLLHRATRSVKTTADVSPATAPASGPEAPSAAVGLLRRMLLEDAFVGYIKRYDDQRLEKVFDKMHERHQSALCLSGGGIRSATFALGIVQGLARHNALAGFRYLSTVSGGGYLGSWLSAWIHHEGFEKVLEKLGTTTNAPTEPEAVPVRHLRQFSSYLNPQVGLLSPDTWTLLAIYFRNLLLIWLVLMPLLAAVASLPWVVVTAMFWLKEDPKNQAALAVGLASLGGLLALVGLSYVHAARPRTKIYVSEAEPKNVNRSQSAFLWMCLVPLSGAVLLWVLAWRLFEHSAPTWTLLQQFKCAFQINLASGLSLTSSSGWTLMGVGAALHCIAWAIGLRFQPMRPSGWMLLREWLCVMLVGGITAYFILLVIKLLLMVPNSANALLLYAWLAFPGGLLALLLAGTLYEGFTSTFTFDAQREWSARYGAWFLIVMLVWVVMAGLVLMGPLLVQNVFDWTATSVTGAVSAALTALLGQSSKTSAKPASSASGSTKRTAGVLLAQHALPVAAAVTFAVLFVLLSLSIIHLMALGYHLLSGRVLTIDRYPDMLSALSLCYPLGIGVLLTMFGLAMGRFIDTNRFSLHAMYRARLIRAYLGASRPPGERRPNPFTGFDEADNLPMRNLWQDAGDRRPPFHVLNIALNMVASSARNLAWQERKAESFTVSPRHAGAWRLGYRRTYVEAEREKVTNENPDFYGGQYGISLGTAMTISGAAANPNHGYNSSPLVAFLMTLFNARLGWWLGNPGPAGDKTFHTSAPKQGVKPLVDELTGNTDDVNAYVNLSDGGHFDNLGLYEMVLRRNRFILLSDASCDETCTLEDLGNAIRKIRIDLGVSIDFPLGFNIRARFDTSLPMPTYWAIGRIRYPEKNKMAQTSGYDAADGVLLYVKPGIIGGEPRDVFNYASAQRAFPHESTADQFFTESQFESYRALGLHVLEQVNREIVTSYGFELADLLVASTYPQCLTKLNRPAVKTAKKSGFTTV